jgi:hypothetical protein
LAPSFDGELPVQVTTPASGLDGNDCGQQVAQEGDGTPSFDAAIQACRRRQLELPVFAVEADDLGAFGRNISAAVLISGPAFVP